MQEELDGVERAAIALATQSALHTAYHPAWSREDLYQQGALAVIVARRRRDYSMHGAQRHVWLRRVAWGAMMDAMRTECVREGGVRSPGGGSMLEGAKLSYSSTIVVWSSEDEESGSHVIHNDMRGTGCPVEDLHEKRQLARATKQLSPRLRQILAMLLRGDTLISIGDDLGLSEARICRIKMEIIEALAPAVRWPRTAKDDDDDTVRAFQHFFAVQLHRAARDRRTLARSHETDPARPPVVRRHNVVARPAGQQQRNA